MVFTDEKCVFLCGATSSTHGEHVWPKWYVESVRSGPGPFTAEKDGVPLLNRDGAPRRRDPMPPVQLPVCDGHTGNGCNGKLERRYEAPGRGPVRTASSGRSLTKREEVDGFVNWWIKTLLLVHHPDARHDFQDVELPAWHIPSATYPHLLDGIFPDDLSLWVAVGDDSNGTVRLPEVMRIHLETTSRPDGRGGRPEAGVVGVGLESGRLILFQIVYHHSATSRIHSTTPARQSGCGPTRPPLST